MKKIICSFIFLLLLIFVPKSFAQDNSFISVINPVRGSDFWSFQNQKPETAVFGQIEILTKFNLPATWLIRFDALDDNNIINALKKRSDEKGLFLEITPTWAKEAKVSYHQSESWHFAGSAFLTGYERDERKELIDTAFDKFKNIFGSYPVSVGAWWIDAYSLDYMQGKYGITGALIVSDQYSTDNYQIWGQYFSTPYYPSKNNALHPAQTMENKLPVIMVQWAARDPVNAYGNGVFESTFSVQANDYIDYHKLDTAYFSKLLDIYTKQKFNQFGHVVVGLENSYPWEKYKSEYEKQIEVLSQKQKTGQLKIVSQKDFSSWYKQNFPSLSPEQIVVADDPLGSFKKAIWFMNSYYRSGWFVNDEGSVFRDIRQYIDGEEELCFKSRCDSVNFATFATRVLDDVTYGSKWVIDKGKIGDFSVLKESEGYFINYTNEAGNKRKIELLPRDIKVDGKVSTIDGAILNVIKQDKIIGPKHTTFDGGLIEWSIPSVFIKITSFLIFLIIACLVPGLVLTNKLFEKSISYLQRLFLSIVIGFVSVTVVFYLTGLLNLRFLSFVYIIVNLLLFIKVKIWTTLELDIRHLDKLSLISLLVIICGVIFQNIPTFRSGLTFSYGLGFWGPNTHDGIWHISLINQIIKGLPPGNPIFSDTILKNYHFFYDLLVATTNRLSGIPVLDLVFRFYPVVFSILLGMGTYCLIVNLFGSGIKGKVAAIFSLYFVYFSGSFGWIAEYLKNRTFGGESAFWANQSISFNLNPPFAVSLIIIIAFLLIFFSANKISIKIISTLVLLGGTLIGFKVYGAALLIGSLLPLTLISLLKKEFSILIMSLFIIGFSGLIFLSNFEPGQQLIIFSPFWFIHSMIDSESRLGWARLSFARVAGIETRNWFKYISAEAIGLVLFIAGNLGFRILSFGALVKLKALKDRRFLFILIFSLLSIIVPVIFIQTGNPWNTIQFSYYGLYTTALIAGIVLSSLILRISNVLVKIIIIAVILILTPVNSVTTASYYIGRPHAIISSQELAALKFLSVQPEGIVLTYPYDDKLKQKLNEPWPLFVYDSTAYVGAISKKSVFVEDEIQNQIILTDYKKRLISSGDFFQNSVSQKIEFLKDNKIKYIYIPKIYKLYLDEKTVPVKTIFENEEVKIYQRI